MSAVWKAGWNMEARSFQKNKDEAGRQLIFVAPPSTSTLIQPIISRGRWLNTGDENAIVVGNQILDIFPT